MTIFRKITAPFIAFLLLSLVLTAPSLYVLSAKMEQTATQTQSVGGAIEMSRGLDIILAQARRQTELLASMPTVSSILLRSPTTSPDLPANECVRVRELLQFSAAASAAIDIMDVINDQGEVVCSSYPLTEGTQRQDRLYFQNAMSGESVMEGPLTARSTGQPVVTLAAPIRVNGQVKGVLSCAIALEKLNIALTKKTSVQRNGSVYVLSARGQVIIHPQHNVLLSSDFFPPERIAEMQKTGQGMFRRERSDGHTVRVAYVTLTDPDWIVLYEDGTEQLPRIPLTRNIGFLAAILPLLGAVCFLVPALYRMRTDLKNLTLFAQQNYNTPFPAKSDGTHADDSAHYNGMGEPEHATDSPEALNLADLPPLLQRVAKRRDELGELARNMLLLTQETTRAQDKVKQSIGETQRSRKELLKLINCMDGVGAGVAAIRLDAYSTIIWASQGFFQLYGLVWNAVGLSSNSAANTAQLIALTQDPMRAVHPEDVPMLADILTTATRQQGIVQAAFRIIKADDKSCLPLIMRGTVVGYDGAFPVFLAVFMPDPAATEHTSAAHDPHLAGEKNT